MEPTSPTSMRFGTVLGCFVLVSIAFSEAQNVEDGLLRDLTRIFEKKSNYGAEYASAPPYGINAALRRPPQPAASQSAVSQSELVRQLTRLFIDPQTTSPPAMSYNTAVEDPQNALSRAYFGKGLADLMMARSPPQDAAIAAQWYPALQPELRPKSALSMETRAWSELARDMIYKLFSMSATTPPPLPQMPASSSAYMADFPALIQAQVQQSSLFGGSPSPDRSQFLAAISPEVRRSPPPKNWIADSIRTLLDQNLNNATNRSAISLVDTGGDTFDRLVVQEIQPVSGDNNNPLGNALLQNFNRKGVQWTDGNLRLVNMQGKKILGSELGVHDRSIDIPVKPWMELAENLFSNASQ